MLRVLCSLLAIATLSSCSHLQFSPDEPVHKQSGFLGHMQYKQKGGELTRRALAQGLEKSPATQQAMDGYKTLKIFDAIFGISGGFLIGWPIGQKIGGNDNPNWTLAWIGAGLGLVSVVFEGFANKKLDRAVDLHNTTLGSSGGKTRSSIEPAIIMSQRDLPPAFGFSVRY